MELPYLLQLAIHDLAAKGQKKVMLHEIWWSEPG